MKIIKMTPNRYNLFMSQQQDLHLWLLKTPILRFYSPLNKPSFELAVEKLIAENDGLQIQFVQRAENNLEQLIIHEPLSRYIHYITVPNFYNDNDLYRFIENEVHQLENQYKFPGPLFKVIQFNSIADDYLIISVHHALSDRISMQLITNRFFELYENSSIISKGLDRQLSYCDYVERFTAQARKKMAEYNSYWDGIDWSLIHKNIKKFNNGINGTGFQKDAIINRFSLHVDFNLSISSMVIGKIGFSLLEIILFCISCAYSHTWDAKGIYLALVHHNRDRLDDGAIVRNIIGWLSTTYPLLLSVNHFSFPKLENIRAALSDIEYYGNGFGFIKYSDCGNNKRNNYIEPAISLNYIDQTHKSFNYRNIVNKDIRFKQLSNLAGKRVRQYQLSGGAIINNNTLTLQWDYSPNILNDRLIYLFNERCRDYLARLLKEAGIAANCSSISVSADE